MAFGRNRFAARKDASKYGKRHVDGKMNQTESAYAEILEARKIKGEIVEWRFERTTLKIADDRCSYTPDFEVIYIDGSKEYIDCKGAGPVDDKSIVKIKVAANLFWEFRFAIEKRQTKKNGGGWKRTEY